jgi:hypothetical protein
VIDGLRARGRGVDLEMADLVETADVERSRRPKA